MKACDYCHEPWPDQKRRCEICGNADFTDITTEYADWLWKECHPSIAVFGRPDIIQDDEDDEKGLEK